MPALRDTAVALAFAAAFALPCRAQVSAGERRREVIGTVRDVDGAPIVGASVRASWLDVSTVSGEGGRFRIPLRLPDTAWITVRMIMHGGARLRVGDLPRDPADTSRAIADVVLRPPGLRELDITDDTALSRYLVGVAPAAGLRPLRDVARQRGDAEIRLYLGGGIFVPEDMIVLTRQSGRVTGAVWLWWSSPRNWFTADSGSEAIVKKTVADAEAAWEKHAAEFGCPHAAWHYADGTTHATADRALRGRPMLVCRASFVREPDWVALWRRLDSLGVWTLPDEHELVHGPSMALDGIRLWVEVFDGQRYRTYSHGNPNPKSSPEANRAAEILAASLDVLRQVRNHAASR